MGSDDEDHRDRDEELQMMRAAGWQDKDGRTMDDHKNDRTGRTMDNKHNPAPSTTAVSNCSQGGRRGARMEMTMQR
ncbi:hypothetical protein L208DRAFT_1399595 [Tricholoma matsutake]|nr:hypothetical protein L208DRAFT_1399595 [Tricholoma matsutake 945]